MSFTVHVGHAQVDGRKYVLEVHSDAQGELARLEYLAEENADFNAIATARTANLIEQLAQQELEDAVLNDVMPALRFQTASEFVQRMREAFRNRGREVLCRLARWILNRIDAGDLTDLQVRNAFGLTNPEYNTLKTKMTVLRDALNSVDNAAGE
jgi:hypothetical protein